MNIIRFPYTIKKFYVNMTAFIPVLSPFLLVLFYLGTFCRVRRNSVHFFKTRAGISDKTHNGELELAS